jgi:hypothetical protein
MNELIKEIAYNAGFITKKNNGDEWRWGYIDQELEGKIEKFAKLIVEACAAEFDRRNNGIGFYEPHEPAEIIRSLLK